MHEEHGRDPAPSRPRLRLDRSRAGDNGLLLQHDQEFSGISPAHPTTICDAAT